MLIVKHEGSKFLACDDAITLSVTIVPDTTSSGQLHQTDCVAHNRPITEARVRKPTRSSPFILIERHCLVRLQRFRLVNLTRYFTQVLSPWCCLCFSDQYNFHLSRILAILFQVPVLCSLYTIFVYAVLKSEPSLKVSLMPEHRLNTRARHTFLKQSAHKALEQRTQLHVARRVLHSAQRGPESQLFTSNVATFFETVKDYAMNSQVLYK